MLIALALLLGCPSGGSLSRPKIVDSGASGVPTEQEAFQAAGFEVGEGAMVFSTMEGCCDVGANCWGNNPSTPYGTHAVPPPPGGTVRDDALLEAFGPIPPGLSRDFLLRPDEALVWVGTMPPPARYFGFRSYLGERPGVDHYVIGSLGESLNHQVVEAQRGAPGWGEPLAVVTSADAEVEADVIDGLVQAGWERAHIHVDRLPPSVVHLGLDPLVHDTLFTVARVAVYDDPAAGAAWEADAGTIWRLTPREERPLSAPHQVPSLLSRGDGQTEEAWAQAWLALAEGVAAAHLSDDGTLAQVIPYWRETIACIDSEQSCTGDLRDRYVGISPYFQLPTPDSYMVSFGVNHERTGSSTYASVSIQTITNQRGITSFDSVDMVGSARPYTSHELVDDLYAVIWARDCSPFEGVCIEVPWDCPGGDASERFKITARAYLEPTTGAAPLPQEMLDDMLYLVIPEPK